MPNKTLALVFFVVFFAPGANAQEHGGGSHKASACENRLEAMGGQTHGEVEMEFRVAKCLPKHFILFADFLKVGEHSGMDGGLKFQAFHRQGWGVNFLSGVDRLHHYTKVFVGTEAEAEFRHWRFGASGILGGRFSRMAEFGAETPKLKLFGNVRLGPVVRVSPHGTQFLAKISKNF